jgi:hypothetical protein
LGSSHMHARLIEIEHVPSIYADHHATVLRR